MISVKDSICGNPKDRDFREGHWQNEEEYLMAYAFGCLFSLCVAWLAFTLPFPALPPGLHCAGIGALMASTIAMGVASTASSLVQRGGNALGDEIFGSSLDEQKELMDYQYQKQEQFIDRQNEYNTPANQMQRFIDAGINPNLGFSNGLGSAGMSQQQLQNPTQMRTTADFNNLLASAMNHQQTGFLQQALAKTEDEGRAAKLEGMLADAEGKQILNDMHSFESKLLQKYGDSKEKASLEYLISGYEERYANAIKLVNEGKIADIDAYLKKEFGYIEHLVDYLQKDQNLRSDVSQFNVLFGRMNMYVKQLDAAIKKEKALANEANASALEHREGARLNSENAQKVSYENMLTSATYKEKRKQILSALAAETSRNNELRAEADRWIDILDKLSQNPSGDAFDKALMLFKERFPSILGVVSPK